MIFAARFLHPEMDENINSLPSEDLPHDQEKLSISERTKLFLKKLEIQHKVLKKIIDADSAGIADMVERPVQNILYRPDKPQNEK